MDIGNVNTFVSIAFKMTMLNPTSLDPHVTKEPQHGES